MNEAMKKEIERLKKLKICSFAGNKEDPCLCSCCCSSHGGGKARYEVTSKR